MSEGDIRQESQGESRREFLKKAGKVAWVVPTLQVVNMSAALAGGDGTGGSVVVTTPPTTESPRCECQLIEKDRQPAGNESAQVNFHLEIDRDCASRAEYLEGFADGDSFGLRDFATDFPIFIPFDAFPVTIRVDVLDGDHRVLASCSTRVEGMGDPQPGLAAAGGKRVSFTR